MLHVAFHPFQAAAHAGLGLIQRCSRWAALAARTIRGSRVRCPAAVEYGSTAGATGSAVRPGDSSRAAMVSAPTSAGLTWTASTGPKGARAASQVQPQARRRCALAWSILSCGIGRPTR